MKHLARTVLILLLLGLFPVTAACSDDPTPPRAMLTFDDGPSGKVTASLLDLLREEEVHATFFLCGYRIEDDPDLAARIAAEGHAIGSHGYTHAYLSHASPEQIRRELTDSIRLIEEITGEKVHLFRPPGGLYNRDVLDEMERAGVELALWDVDPEDWKGGTADAIAQSVLQQVHPDCVILLHDMKPATVEATRIIIHALREQNYEFATMS